MIINDHEKVLSLLFAHLAASVVTNFTATTTANSPALTAVSDLDGLFEGLPVFGPGVPRGALVLSLDTDAGTVTLDQPITQDGTAAAFVTGFLTTGRRVKFWTDVPAQPAMYLRHTDDDDVWDGTLGKTILMAEIWIYSRAGQDPDAAPDTGLNNLARCIRNAFAPDDPDNGVFTLGGQVYWARIEGTSNYDPGDIDAQSKAVIPVKILCP